MLHRIFVPLRWLTTGACISVTLPRLLSCARCEGGGCDACDRGGALALCPPSEVPAPLIVRLGVSGAGQAQLIRIPERGAPAAESEWPAGCLMLRVEPGELSSGVGTANPAAPAQWGGYPSKVWLLLPFLTGAVWWLAHAFAD